MSLKEWCATHEVPYRDSDLIEQAFVHTSYLNEHPETIGDNERLEFIGDAVLQLWTAGILFKLTPAYPEGEMTTMRAQLVCEKSLADYTRKLGLNGFLKLGIGEERTGGRDRDSILADAFEAFIGALYLEMGFDAADTVLHLAISVATLNKSLNVVVDYKTRLQEFAQSDDRKTVAYEVLSIVGPSNKPEFEIAVKVDGIVMGKGRGNSKKRAEQAAAKDALAKLAV
jgi:ribonuclease-3